MKLFLSLMILFAAVACKKDKVSGTQIEMSVINASPNSNGITVIQSGKNLGNFNYVSGMAANAQYISADSGFRNYQIRSSSGEIARTLFSNDGLKYSLYVFDSAAAGRINYFFLNDIIDTTGLGRRSRIRIVHISPNLDSLDLVTPRFTAPSIDSLIYNNVPYFGNYEQSTLFNASSFDVFPGDTVMTIRIRRRVDNTIARSYQLNFAKGKVYSLVVKGYDKRIGKDSLSLSVITHN